MKLSEIEALDKEMLLASDIAPYLGVNAHDIRLQAQKEPEKLGFPVIVMGTRIHIPKHGFVHYVKYGRFVAEG